LTGSRLNCSAAVFFALDPYRAILSDINKELIDLYLGIKYHVSDVWQIFSGFPTTKEGYYKVRDNKFETEDLAYKAARTLSECAPMLSVHSLRLYPILVSILFHHYVNLI
jgi:site-specific DNA-adenine methylase